MVSGTLEFQDGVEHQAVDNHNAYKDGSLTTKVHFVELETFDNRVA